VACICRVLQPCPRSARILQAREPRDPCSDVEYHSAFGPISRIWAAGLLSDHDFRLSVDVCSDIIEALETLAAFSVFPDLCLLRSSTGRIRGRLVSQPNYLVGSLRRTYRKCWTPLITQPAPRIFKHMPLRLRRHAECHPALRGL